MSRQSLTLLQQAGAQKYQVGSATAFDGLHFDSRKIESGMLFCAMQGASVDGHDFVQDAYERGACAFLVERDVCLPADATIYHSPSTLKTLQSAASLYREHHKGLVIGITGSVGKTTTKDFLKTLLGPGAYASPGNFNNTLGLPITLLNAPQHAEFIVLEMGISRPGEMSTLAAVARPDVALVTCIKSSHAGCFASRAEHVAAKLAISSQAKANHRLFVTQEGWQDFSESLPTEVNVTRLESVKEAALEERRLRLGEGPYECLQMAWGMALQLGVCREEMLSRLDKLELSPLRMEDKKIGHASVLLDCYNAAPESMDAFLESVGHRMRAFQRPVLVLGDMLELGEGELLAHQKIVEKAESLGTPVFLVGGLFCSVDSKASQIRKFSDTDSLKEALKSYAPDFAAFKASRSFGLENVAAVLDESCSA